MTNEDNQPVAMITSYFVGGLIAAVCACFVGYQYYVQIEETVTSETVQQTELDLRNVRGRVDTLLDTLLGIVTSAAVHGADKAETTDDDKHFSEARFNKALAERFSSLRTIITVSADGIILSDTRDGNPGRGIDVSDRAYFRAHLDPDGPDYFVSEPIESRVDGKWTWVMSMPIRNKQGELLAVSLVSLDRRYFADVFDETRGMPGAYYMLVHDNGTILESTDAREIAIGGSIEDYENLVSITDVTPAPLQLAAGPDGADGRPGDFGGRRWPVQAHVMISEDFFGNRLVSHRERAIALTALLVLVSTILTVLAYRSAALNFRARQAAENAKKSAQIAHFAAVRANDAKTRFLANTSHELRTPLNAIIGFAELIQQLGTANLKQKTLNSYIEDIHASGKHLLDLINDLLDISRIETGQIVLDIQPHTPRGVVDQALGTSRPFLDRHKIRVDVEIRTGQRIHCDQRALTQCLTNLLTNAAKFSPENSRVSLSISERDHWLDIVVEDWGCGIGRDVVQQLGQPFLRGNDPHVATTEGTGLGLAITKNLVDHHKGSFSIAAKDHGGTRAVISLRLKPHAIPNRGGASQAA